MDGALFYWFTWIFWIITTFFMKKENKNRLPYSICLLAAIIASPYQASVWGYTVSWLLLFILGAMFIYMACLKKAVLFYFFLCVFIFMIVYCTFQFLAVLDPIWVIIDQNWMAAIVLMILARLLYSAPSKQIATIIFGSITGDILYGVLLKQYNFYYVIGALKFFDCLFICIAGITVIYSCKAFLAKWEHHIYIMEKEKQKLS
ncbi:YphA family membrane protein [Niallia sp. 03133]|uniref:YphA family membrane protein n=1 Tax=Niallia sp. 03133 TaxID=3458060 RepID=UPI00404422A3